MHLWIIIVALFVIAGACGIWTLMGRAILRLGGLQAAPDLQQLGNFQQTLGLGSAKINGANLRNCVHLDRYDQGYVLRVMKVFGGGQKVLLDSDIKLVSAHRGLLTPYAYITLASGETFELKGKMVKYLNSN